MSVIVSTGEVHRSQEVISSLKHTHHLNVQVQAKFEGAGYLLSSRLAVCRISNNDFCNGAQRHKLVNMCQTMNEYFERPFLIVESPDSVPLEARQHRTKYVDMIMSQLAQSNIRVLFSSCQTETASFMATLARKEDKKNFALPRNLKIPLLSEKYLVFYMNLPNVNYALALNMVNTFHNPGEMIRAAQATLVRRLKIEEKRAQKIHGFCRATFHTDMTSKI